MSTLQKLLFQKIVILGVLDSASGAIFVFRRSVMMGQHKYYIYIYI